MFGWFVVLCLIQFTSSARILTVFWVPCFSHQSVFHEITRELSLQGHQVTSISPIPLNDRTLVNLTEIDIGKKAEQIMKNFNANKHDSVVTINNFINLVVHRQRAFEDLAEVALIEVKRISNDPFVVFDVILLEPHFPLVFAVSCAFNVPVIGVSSFGLFLNMYDALGNPSHPVLSPDFYFTSINSSGMLMKLQSILYSLFYRFTHYWYTIPMMDKVAKRYFKDCPYLGELESNVSLVLVNESPILHSRRPVVPSLINMGFVHIKRPKQLPQDLQEYLDDSKHGVVYFSLGATIHTIKLEEKTINLFLETFSELPYNILWKWDGDLLPDYPKNIKFSKWWPQQDLLHHKNVRVFVTQVGLQSLEEAIMAEVPMVGIPLLLDQYGNADNMERLGIGVQLDFTKLTKSALKSAIFDVAKNEQYRKKIQEIKKLVLDQPMTGLERAVWWIEYVIRNNGTSYLRSANVGYPWIEYYFFDVFAYFLTTMIILVVFTRKMFH